MRVPTDLRDHAEKKAWDLLMALEGVSKGDETEIKSALNQISRLPGEYVRDYELRKYLENSLLDFQTKADFRLKTQAYLDQADALGIKDPSKMSLAEVAEVIKKFNEDPGVSQRSSVSAVLLCSL